MVGVHNIVRCISYRDIIENALHSSEQSTTKVRFPTMNYDNKQQSVRKTYSIAQLLGPSCKSTESRIQFKVCFRNLSEDDASIYWIDFEGKPVSYGFIRKGRSNSTGLDIDTFVSHPWIAVSRRRKKLLAINFERVFRPMTSRAFLKESIKIDRLRVHSQHQEDMESVQPNEISQLEEIQHVDAFITELVLQLELSCCLKICKMLSMKDIKELKIPIHIKEKITDVYDTWMLA